jgi:hypothetical protein
MLKPSAVAGCGFGAVRRSQAKPGDYIDAPSRLGSGTCVR